MFRKMKAGSTSQSVPIFVQDSSSTTGAGLGSLVYNTSGLAAKYRRQGESSWTTITLATMTLGTWASGGFVTDGGPVTGTYEFGIPNAILASGAEWAEVAIYGAANMLAVLIFVELDVVNYQSATSFITQVGGITVLDAAATRAAVGLASPSLDTQLSAIAGYIDTEVSSLVSSVAALPSSAQIADKILGRNIAGSADGGRTVTQALRALRNRWTRTADTYTVYAEDDSTTSWTSTLTTSDTLDPVSESNP